MTDQYRLTRIQLVNWGTFDGYFDLPVPARGLLLTGPSGSGKSSVLDAMATVLVHPKWLTLNAAAQEGGRDRSRTLATYVRGAYKRTASEESGEIAAAYLRVGATWSAVALTYEGPGGGVSTAARLMHLARGATAAADVRSLFLLADEAVDLPALAEFVVNGLDRRAVKRAHGDWLITDVYSTFAAGLHRRLGLSDQAQHLLHKTQSAKNLDSLDGLLRDFMLDQPRTFDLVDQAIDQFTELRSAHATVVDARQQIAALTPLSEAAGQRQDRLDRRDRAEQLAAGVETVRLQTHARLASARLEELNRRQAGLAPELDRAEADLRDRRDDRLEAELALRTAGGDRLEVLAAERVEAESALARTRRSRSQAESLAVNCGQELPRSANDMKAFLQRIELALADSAETEEDKQARYDLVAEQRRLSGERAQVAEALKLAESEGSALPPQLLAVRDFLVKHGADRSRLPFAGELLAVDPAQARWTGALERVLHGLARTLLVPADLYPLVSDLVDRGRLVDRAGRGVRLVYERINDSIAAELPHSWSGGPGDGAGGPNSVATNQRSSAVGEPLADKLTVTDGEFHDWLSSTLERRFDYQLVESASDLRLVDRGVTLAGQIRHSRSRHEKDDRHSVDDRLHWVLGSSGGARREALIEELGRLRRAESEASSRLGQAEQADLKSRQLQQALQQLQAIEWSAIDIDGAQRQVGAITERINLLRVGSADLAAAERAAEQARRAETEADAVNAELRRQVERLRFESEELQRSLDAWQLELLAAPTVDESVADELAGRFSDDPAATEGLAQSLSREFASQIKALGDQVEKINARAVRSMTEYSTSWPAQAAGVTPDVDYLNDYLQILQRLSADRLPDFEGRFFELLQSQTRNNVGTIASTIRASRREVTERIGPINDSLALTDYSPGNHLFLRVDDRRLPEVTAFLQDLNTVTAGSLEDSWSSEQGESARAMAEQRFVKLAGLLDKLSSSDPADRRWRNVCLDTRLHIQFIAEERNASGEPVNFYKDAGGLSGGERQKLVVFCLAAALRYQLARDGSPRPRYALVVLDEAFDKTDPAFTRLGLEVFMSFGFQLLLATPEKMLQTLEDYVGGVVLVHNDPGQGSRVDKLIWEQPESLSPPPPPAEQDDLFGGWNG
ncbi:MAG: hypothetical protein LBV30_01390 [Propionibacteriaceae bacterium]|jgi:uncharacterized protein YPO0396|nr:hypothetical protein [Propionibacteriaceae bacterium]